MPNNDKTTKKTKPQPDSEPAVKKSRYKPLGGRKKKERQQISVRIDKQVMELLYTLAEKKGQRITDVLEYGGMLAVKEGLAESMVTEQARFLVAMASPDEQWLVTLFLCYLRLPSDHLSVFNSMDRETFKKKMYMLATRSDFRDVLKNSFGELRDPLIAHRASLDNSLLQLRNELVHGRALTPTAVAMALGLTLALET